MELSKAKHVSTCIKNLEYLQAAMDDLKRADFLNSIKARTDANTVRELHALNQLSDSIQSTLLSAVKKALYCEIVRLQEEIKNA